MVRPLAYAVKCRMGYSPGKEENYARCILCHADYYAEKNPRGEDKHVVRRATKALIDLQKQNPGGATGKQILSQARLWAYNGPNDGLWPWLEEYGGLPVVEKMQGRMYRVVDKFYPVLQLIL